MIDDPLTFWLTAFALAILIPAVGIAVTVIRQGRRRVRRF